MRYWSTTVALWLPQGKADAASAGGVATPAGPADVDSHGTTVLLVEDQPGIREVLAVELEDHGFVVAQAEHAAAALALLDGGLRPDVVLTDLAMPGDLDGVGLIKHARRRLPRLPTVLMTGHTADPAADRLERGGAFVLVRKPVAADALVAHLTRLIGESRRDTTAARAASVARVPMG